MKNEKKYLTARDLAPFLGCEIEWMGERGHTLIGVNADDECFNPVVLKKGECHYWVKLDEVRPVLRPLSDMTKGENLYLRYIVDVDPQMQDAELWVRLSAYLSQCHIDAFGWIPAGLAVDATKKEVRP